MDLLSPDGARDAVRRLTPLAARDVTEHRPAGVTPRRVGETAPLMTMTTDAVEARLAQAYAQMRAGDIDGLVTLYLPDAIIQSAGQPPVAGREAIRAFWRATFAAYRVDLTHEIREARVFGEVVVVGGRAVGELVPTDGASPIPVDTWFQQIYVVQPDGSVLFWRGANGPNPQAT